MKKYFFILLCLNGLNSFCFAKNSPKTIHVIVALCDNVHQRIVPVRPQLGNGNDTRNNLYWGALYGVKTFFRKSKNWSLISTVSNPENEILERCIFKHKIYNVYLIADAHKGKEIKKAIDNVFQYASGGKRKKINVKLSKDNVILKTGGYSDLIVYVGHNGLMDFQLSNYPKNNNNKSKKDIIILACNSKAYFHDPLIKLGSKPILLTMGRMAPEAYTLENAIEGWILNEDIKKIQLRAAEAYNKYQKCGIKAAKWLFDL